MLFLIKETFQQKHGAFLFLQMYATLLLMTGGCPHRVSQEEYSGVAPLNLSTDLLSTQGFQCMILAMPIGASYTGE